MNAFTRSALIAVLIVACALGFAGCDAINSYLNPPPAIKFAPAGKDYREKPDFARVEQEFPIAVAELEKLTPANLKNFSQEELDQIYARLTAGPMPDGPLDGDLIFPKGEEGDRRLAEIVGGLPGFAVELKLHRVEDLGRMLWKGKVFYRKDRLLRNRIEDTTLLKPLIEGDLKTIQQITVGGKDQWLLFPARLYCGQSLLDSRRESIIIDYFFTDELPGYRQRPDYLAGRNGLKVRDEIRMVRPGLYLGRAYIGRVFLVNFFLYSKEIAGRDGPGFVKTGTVQEDCWSGTQARATVAGQ
jgi:hypothetical protein